MRKKADPLKKLPAGPLFKKADDRQILAAALNPTAIIDERENYLFGRQTDAWMAFVMSGDTKFLADYIEYGGKLEGQFRDALIDILRNGAPKEGKMNDWKCYETYVAVNSVMANEDVKITEAQRQHAAETNQTPDAVRKQYKRGNKLFGE